MTYKRPEELQPGDVCKHFTVLTVERLPAAVRATVRWNDGHEAERLWEGDELTTPYPVLNPAAG